MNERTGSQMRSNRARALISRLFLALSATSVLPLILADKQPIQARASRKAASFLQAERDWDRYTLTDGEFSVLLPTVPAMSTFSRRLDRFSKSQQRNLIGAYAQGVVYAILIFEVRQSLDEFIAASGLKYGSELTREVTVSGIRGKECTFENDNIRRVTQFFVRGQQIYVFKAQGSRLGNPDVGIPRFFESIKFDRPSGGLVIVDGPGNQESKDTTVVTDGKDAAVFTGREVATKAMVITKPEPAYTDEARERKITGTVVLRCEFSSSGAVTNIRVVSDLPHGLTEKAIAAARQIRFIPAVKDGKFVSIYIQLEYNFNLY